MDKQNSGFECADHFVEVNKTIVSHYIINRVQLNSLRSA